jgi:DNA topoisomerase-1
MWISVLSQPAFVLFFVSSVMQKNGKLSHTDLIKAAKDHKKAARVASLIYVSAEKEGITRRRKCKGFIYIFKKNGKRVKEKTTIEMIRKLAIPPSWSGVWISPVKNGHIQATGTDLNGRKQYRYHPSWHELRTMTKFHNLFEFGKSLPRLRRRVHKDLKKKGLPEEKVMAVAISLLDKTYIRVGSDDYEKLYGSYGLTTLKDKHVRISRDKIHICFTGKKGIEQAVSLKSRRLARIIKQCRDIPGKELFQYYDSEGKKKKVDSGKLNNYIKQHAGGEFSAKDFRTWAGSLHAICFLKKAGEENGIKKTVIDMLDDVSRKLGNSRNICKKYYVHPGLVSLFEENKLQVLLQNHLTGKQIGENEFTPEEHLLLAALKKCF